MRTYGRVPKLTNGAQLIDPSTGAPALQWVEVDTTPDGFNDLVYATTLVQCLQLELGESPFYGNYGIPGRQSVIQQIAPDFYMMQTQAQFASFFANLTIAKIATPKGYAVGTPAYRFVATTHAGFKLSGTSIAK